MRLGLSNFLNAKPLVEYLPNFSADIFWGPPSQCADYLKDGKIDMALLPSIEYASAADLMLVPGLGISSFGAVHSVLLLTHQSLENVQTIAVDERSRTAAGLLRILCHEVFHICPRFILMPPDIDVMLSRCDAAMMIGDCALRVGQKFGGRCFDLGERWTRWSGKPFTYAFFAGRRDGVSDEDIRCLIEACFKGLKSIPRIAEREAGDSFSKEFLLSYLSRSIQYEMTDLHELGLKLFYEKAYQYQLIENIPELNFYGVAAHR